jgi:hypothetical protein
MCLYYVSYSHLGPNIGVLSSFLNVRHVCLSRFKGGPLDMIMQMTI